MRLALSISLLLVLASGAAYANIYVPSVVEMIASPLVWSIYVVTLVITFPAILAVALAETMTVKRRIAKGAFWRAFWSICAMNAATSLIRLPIHGSQMIWPGLPIAFALTVPVEALLVRAFLSKRLAIDSWRSAFAVSTRMNGVSYALLGTVVAGLTYIPTMGNESPQLLPEITGKLVLQPRDESRVLDLQSKRFTIGGQTSLLDGRIAECYAVAPDQSVVRVEIVGSPVLRDSTEFRITRARVSGNQWRFKEMGRVSPMVRVCAVSPDSHLLLCKMEDKWVIYDRKRGTLRSLPQGNGDVISGTFSRDSDYLAVSRSIDIHNSDGSYTSRVNSSVVHRTTGMVQKLGEVWQPVFSPCGPQLAWQQHGSVIIYDCKRRTRKKLRTGGDVYEQIAWSPDARFIVYMCRNPLTSNGWERDVRVMEVSTGDSVTACRGVFTAGRPGDLLWLK